jgi:nitroreductase
MVLGCLKPVGHSNMQLVAWSEGVGWVCLLELGKKIRTDFNIPEDLDIVVIISFGYPSRKLTGMPEKNNKID